jgi:hypothetical protein
VSRRPGENREKMVSRYLEQGNVLFAPQCSKRHRDAGEKIPIDWPHTLAAVYRVRCNFFHGEKALSSEMDQQIVSCAYKTLLYFFQRGKVYFNMKKPPHASSERTGTLRTRDQSATSRMFHRFFPYHKLAGNPCYVYRFLPLPFLVIIAVSTLFLAT